MEELAILGGSPARLTPFPPETSNVGEEEIAAVVQIARSGRLSMFSSPAVRQFEEEFANYIGVKYAVMTSSCTAAMHLALAAAGVGYGDEVIVPAVTYIATPNAVMAQNSNPLFADIDLKSYNLDVRSVEANLTPATKAILAVDLFGNPSDKGRLMALCEDHGLALIEDCAHAVGAMHQGRKVGAFGIGCFSFSEGKNMTTGGEGGMLTTDDSRIYNVARILRHEGEVWTQPSVSAADTRIETFVDFMHGRRTASVGYNYRPTALQAAFGQTQLNKVDSFNARRIDTARIYLQQLSDVPGIVLPTLNENDVHVFNRFVLLIDSESLHISRDSFVAALVFEGVAAGVYRTAILPVYPVFTKREALLRGKPHPLARSYHKEECIQHLFPKSLVFCSQNVQLPTYDGLTTLEIQDIVAGIRKIVHWALRDEDLERRIRTRLTRMRIRKYSGEFIYPEAIELGHSSE